MNREGFAIALTGTGLVSPLGADLQTTWEALLAGQSVRDHSRALLEHEAGADRICQLSVRAAREAMSAASWDDLDNAAVVLGTSKGPIETWLNAPPAQPILSDVKGGAFGLAQSVESVGRMLNFAGPRMTVSAACASGLHALIRAAMMIERGEVSRALVIGVESSLHPLFVGCFRRLGVLPEPGGVCRPFDENRRGFFLSEAAAAVCLKRVPLADFTGIRLAKYGLGGAAGHMTAGDADGAALRYLIRRVAGDEAIDVVHAHGTGTVAHDLVELQAIRDVVNGEPLIYSHKAALGHSLGAAGLVATVLTGRMHYEQCVLPNVNTTKPEMLASQIKREHSPRAIRRSVIAASGFGGPIGVIRLNSTI